MAEIGIIASGMGVASLGLQLMDGVRKLKQFWDEVKEAPEDIQYALEELDALSLVLSDIHTSNSNLPSIASATVTKCLELCRRGTDILNTTVKDLNGAISKRRKIGSAKVVLKKDTLDKFRNRLRDAQYMLMLSRLTYSDALQMENRMLQMEQNKHHKENHKLQIEAVQSIENRQLQGFEELKVSITRSTNVMSSTLLQARDTVVYDYETKSPVRGRTRPKLDEQAKRFQKKFSTPQLFSSSSYTWDFSGYQAPSGWTFNFRQYYTLDHYSPTWRCVYTGDVSGLQVLLQSKKATPFDRTPGGMTLLDMGGMICAVFFLVKGQTRMTLPGLEADLRYHTALARAEIRTLLYPISEIHNTLQDIPKMTVDPESLAWLLNRIDPTFEEWSFEERMMFALKVSCYSCTWLHSTADVISLMLHKDQLNEVCCKMVSIGRPGSFGDTFLSIELFSMGYAINNWFNRTKALFMYSDSTQSEIGKSKFNLSVRALKNELSTSTDLLKRLIAAGSEIYQGGLLFSLLHQVHKIESPDILRSWTFPVPMQLWLEILHDSGIDLLKYGKVEHAKFLESTPRCYIYLVLMEKRYVEPIHLISFVYGPAVDDWKFWYSLDEPYQNYYKNFRDFWELVDHPERGMPGAWEEN
ncbi:hypothetical protein BGAL_0038g00300 [Botrytis galanthina]|uniref:Fungal N-terminal domain-containing protein n=1 Tax=Botrytis galanthina TaxID=278940 RepID=A0A4S8RA52_9HELO|nr:hypothetical protein BGAL_0038g00300 [Botrytis galanthina]